MHDAERLYLGQDDAGQHVTQSEEDGVAEAISPSRCLFSSRIPILDANLHQTQIVIT